MEKLFNFKANIFGSLKSPNYMILNTIFLLKWPCLHNKFGLVIELTQFLGLYNILDLKEASWIHLTFQAKGTKEKEEK